MAWEVLLSRATRFGLQAFEGNYANDKRFAKTNWLCRCEEAREDELHLASGQCKVFGDLTELYSDLTSDEGLVQFFTAVLERRDQLDKYLQTPDGGTTTIVGANCFSSGNDKPV